MCWAVGYAHMQITYSDIVTYILNLAAIFVFLSTCMQYQHRLCGPILLLKVTLQIICFSKISHLEMFHHSFRTLKIPSFFNFRLDCYKCITEILDYLLSTSMSHPQAPSVPKSPGPPPVQDPNRLTNAEAEQYVRILYSLMAGEILIISSNSKYCFNFILWIYRVYEFCEILVGVKIFTSLITWLALDF